MGLLLFAVALTRGGELYAQELGPETKSVKPDILPIFVDDMDHGDRQCFNPKSRLKTLAAVDDKSATPYEDGFPPPAPNPKVKTQTELVENAQGLLVRSEKSYQEARDHVARYLEETYLKKLREHYPKQKDDQVKVADRPSAEELLTHKNLIYPIKTRLSRSWPRFFASIYRRLNRNEENNVMKQLSGNCLLNSILVLLASPCVGNEDNWPQGAGPNATFQVESTAPVSWSVVHDQNIDWKITLPETGQSTVVTWGELLFFSTMKPVERDTELGNTIFAYCCDSQSGKVLWTREIKGQYSFHLSSPYADSSAPPAVTDGERVCFF